MPTREECDKLDAMTPEDVAHFKGKASRDSFATPRSFSLRRSNPRTLVAQGDSWFNFLLGTDIVDCLRWYHGFTVRNYAKAGDTLENMILGNEVDEDGHPLPAGIERAIQDVRELKPRYFLFSGGGNDVTGDALATYLNHAKDQPAELLRERVVDELIDRVFRRHLETLLRRVTQAHADTVVITHGYARPLPSGKGARFVGIDWKGPWLLPALHGKGIAAAVGEGLIGELVDRYNEMLAEVAAASGGRMRHVDLRGMVGRDDWRDELHLKNSAYARVAERLAEVMG